MLETYCHKNGLNIQRIETALEYYNEIGDLQKSPSFIAKHNEAFLNSHLKSENIYLDNILKSVDPVIRFVFRCSV